MKKTDLLRKERELKRAQKKEERLQSGSKSDMSVGDYINTLASLFFHDGNKIYNINSDEKILELLDEMQVDCEEKHWDNILRKAVKKTQVKERDAAFEELKALL